MSAAVGPAAENYGPAAAGAAASPSPFVIKQRNVGKFSVDSWGQFLSRVPWFSVSRKGMVSSQINGYLIQLIQKKTTVILSNGRVLNTSAAIHEFTNGQVNYMCDSYYEVFPVLGGQTMMGDEFTNGGIGFYRPISKRGKISADCDTPPQEKAKPGESYVLWDDCKTSGEIRMTGTMIFVEEPDIDKIRNLKRIIDASAYGTVSILRYTFQILEQSPAAGIPILAAPPFLLDLPWSDSTLIHKVLVKWSIDGAPVEVSRTVETRMPTAEEVGSATGGARKNVKRTRRHRHLNRRQFRKTRTG